MHAEVGGYRPADITPVAAFDIDARKVGQSLNHALYTPPNCCAPISDNCPDYGVTVEMGPVLDGFPEHMADYPLDRRFEVAENDPCDVNAVLEGSGATILLNYLPVGAEDAVKYWAQVCLDTGVSLINCMPVFIASNTEWASGFRDQGIPIIGDDIKSQLGATIVHRALVKLFEERGVTLRRTYQLNTGGNTDFLNLLARERLASKKISKTEAVQSQLTVPLEWENIQIGPSDYVPWQDDNKVCFLRLEGLGFGDAPVELELRLSVQDSPNSAGVAIEAIRCCQLARDRQVSGALIATSAWLMKHPPKQFPDVEAQRMNEEFIAGTRER